MRAIALATRTLIVAGCGGTLAWGLPGHLSTDSVIQLAEGRFGIRTSFNPEAMSWLLGLFDGIVTGTGLFVVAQAGLLFAALLGLTCLRRHVAWPALPVAAAMLVTPQLLIYPAIVWKDVLFAAAALAGFASLALAVRDGRPRPASTTAALLLLVLAALVRQNGMVVLLPAAVALSMIVARRSGRATGLVAGGAMAGAGVGLAALAGVGLSALLPSETGSATARGLRIVQHYDIVGVAARDPQADLSAIAAVDPEAADTIRHESATLYTPERVDTIGRSATLGRALWRLPADAVQRQWLDLVLDDTGTYVGHRLAVFWQMAATPDLSRCLPLHVGIDGPAETLRALALAPRRDAGDEAAVVYAAAFFGTPVYSHLAWAGLALVTIGLLWRRREPADIVVAAMLSAALLFAASFLPVALACDYRYLYFLDVAAMAGLLYLATDPRVRHRP